VHSSQMFGRTRKEIGIHLDLEKRLWPVEVDSSQMDQVLLNLFVNAWQAMPGGGQLFVRTENVTIGPNGVKTFGLKPGRYVRVTVTDTGIGMDDSTQEKIFDPFFTTKEKGRGTGLGLASAYGIVQNHGGIITVDSTVGQGASFFLLLPATDRLPSVVSKKAPPKVATGSGNILLVDDEEMVLEVGGKMIERLGYTVTAASGGEEALAHYQRSGADIDLVILDMVMPGMDGSETFARLKALDPGVKVLLASGYAIGDRAAAIMKQGCLGFIPKPFNLDYLSQKINQVLEQGETAN
jgi:two-component system cell cycle sensor histidine kinase/response regulator CckA